MSDVILGFEVAGDPLLGQAFIPFRSGLTVFYGLNGAGKSRLMSGVTAALRGERTEVLVGLVLSAVRTGGGRSGEVVDLNRRLTEALKGLDAHDSYVRGPTDQQAPSSNLSNSTIDDHLKWAASSPEETDDDVTLAARPVFEREVLEDRLFFAAPTGTKSAPAWELWPVARPDRPGAAALISRIREIEEDYDSYALEDLTDEIFTRSVDLRTAIPIFLPEEGVLAASTGVNYLPSSVTGYGWPYVSDELQGIPISGLVDFGLDLAAKGNASSATLHFLAEVTGAALSGQSGHWAVPEATHEGLSYYVARHEENWRQPASSGKDRDRLEQAETRAESEISVAADEISRRADLVFARLLRDAPPAALRLGRPIGRFGETPATWRFGRTERMELSQLSRAEKSWAEFAVFDALYWYRRETWDANSETLHDYYGHDPLRPLLNVLDEPEQGLHRSAEADMARALADLAMDPRRAFFVASHSPDLLDVPRAHLVEIRRNGSPDGSSSAIRELDISDRDSLGVLGLRPSDLLRWPRIFLLVEGQHDQIVLESLGGDRLRAARVEVIPTRGGKQLPHTVESRVLFEFTDASVVGLLDNQSAERANRIWERALKLRRDGDLQGAIDEVDRGFRGGKGEDGYLRRWLANALDLGVHDRIFPEGLEKRDVLDYLPVSDFVAGEVSWDALREQHAHARSELDRTPSDFKEWLVQRRGADFSPDRIRSSADNLEVVPPDFKRLFDRLEAISAEVAEGPRLDA
ncbi:MAG: hypothetical protein ACSLFD_05110 [Solirubrobacterales bacterium]